jgi:hypothetical protein
MHPRTDTHERSKDFSRQRRYPARRLVDGLRTSHPNQRGGNTDRMDERTGAVILGVGYVQYGGHVYVQQVSQPHCAQQDCLQYGVTQFAQSIVDVVFVVVVVPEARSAGAARAILAETTKRRAAPRIAETMMGSRRSQEGVLPSLYQVPSCSSYRFEHGRSGQSQSGHLPVSRRILGSGSIEQAMRRLRLPTHLVRMIPRCLIFRALG